MEQETFSDFEKFPEFVRDLRIIIAKYSPTLPMIQRAIAMIFNQEKKKGE